MATTLLPLLLRACDSASTKTQEEVLRGLRGSALDLPYQVLRDALMPKVRGEGGAGCGVGPAAGCGAAHKKLMCGVSRVEQGQGATGVVAVVGCLAYPGPGSDAVAGMGQGGSKCVSGASRICWGAATLLIWLPAHSPLSTHPTPGPASPVAGHRHVPAHDQPGGAVCSAGPDDAGSAAAGQGGGAGHVGCVRQGAGCVWGWVRDGRWGMGWLCWLVGVSWVMVRPGQEGEWDGRAGEASTRMERRVIDHCHEEGDMSMISLGAPLHTLCIGTRSNRLHVMLLALRLLLSMQVLAVDKSAGTAMAVLALGEATAKHYGTEVAAQLVLPMLCPLLVAPTLSNQQFAACMLAMRGMLDAVQEKRGVTDLAAAAAATSGVGAGGGGTAPSTPMSTASSGAAATSSGLGSSSNNSMSSWSAAVGSGAADGVGGAAGASGGSSWQSAASFGAGASPSSTRPAAQAAPSSSWSNAAMGSSWAAPSTSNTSTSMAQGGGLGASGSAGGSGGWGASWPAAGGVAATSTSAPAGVKPGAPAPDIFSDPSAGLGSLGGLSLSGTPSLQQQQQVGGLGGGAADSDLFGGLSMRTVSPAGAPASTSSRPSWSSGPPQQQQQQQTAGIGGFGLQPPPSAKTSIGVTNLVSTATTSSSSAQDPFAMLGSGPPAAVTTSTWQTAAAAPAAPLAGSSAAFDPFASPAAAGDPFAALSAAPPSRPMGGAPAAALAAGGVDPFASLAAGSKPMGMAQQKAQQQQQWGGPGGSLI